jgi:hypothetical protein
MCYVGKTGGTGFLLNNGVMGTAAHCLITAYQQHNPSDRSDDEDLENYGVWPSRPEIKFGLSNTTTTYPSQDHLKHFSH